jgi:hypothetical protein
MAQQIKIKFISQGFKEILCGGGVQSVVQNATDMIQQKANANNARGGEGFEAHVWMGSYGGGRWVGSVNTTDYKSRIAEAEDKALSRAVSR